MIFNWRRGEKKMDTRPVLFYDYRAGLLDILCLNVVFTRFYYFP